MQGAYLQQRHQQLPRLSLHWCHPHTVFEATFELQFGAACKGNRVFQLRR
jgi:hypothetical protein